jgi:hypothetical protein
VTTPDRRARTLLGVLLVALAVVAMHSLGAGHGPPAATHQAVGMLGGVHHADPAQQFSAPIQPAGDCTPGCLTADETGAGHATGAMCLAVLSSLVTLLLLAVRRSRASRASADATWTSLQVIAPSRAPPRRLALDLSQVCVLRT